MQTAHSTTRPLNRPATEYPTRATIPGLLHKVSYSCHGGHLEEGKPQKPTKGMKSGKAKQNGKKELRKAQKSKKDSNSTQKLKINTPPKINSPNTPNASSLLR
jgi:hypothetical protein